MFSLMWLQSINLVCCSYNQTCNRLFFMMRTIQLLLQLQYRIRILIHLIVRMCIFCPLIHRIYLALFLSLAFLILFIFSLLKLLIYWFLIFIFKRSLILIDFCYLSFLLFLLMKVNMIKKLAYHSNELMKKPKIK